MEGIILISIISFGVFIGIYTTKLLLKISYYKTNIGDVYLKYNNGNKNPFAYPDYVYKVIDKKSGYIKYKEHIISDYINDDICNLTTGKIKSCDYLTWDVCMKDCKKINEETYNKMMKHGR